MVFCVLIETKNTMSQRYIDIWLSKAISNLPSFPSKPRCFMFMMKYEKYKLKVTYTLWAMMGYCRSSETYFEIFDGLYAGFV